MKELLTLLLFLFSFGFGAYVHDVDIVMNIENGNALTGALWSTNETYKCTKEKLK